MKIKRDKIIVEENDIKNIDWSNLDQYDFLETPKELRNKVLGEFLSKSFQVEFNKHYDLTKKSLSQNMYARKVLNISPMGFSTYKNGTRMPTGENLDNIANHLGDIVYDMCGVPRRMPKDKDFEELVAVWSKLNETQQNEILELVNSFLGKQEN